VPAYVTISNIYRYFQSGRYFLRLDDYSICSAEEKQALLYDDDELREADFLQFSECPGDTIDLFLASIHNAPLRRKFAQYKTALTPYEYYGKFYHIVMQERNYHDEYRRFEKERLRACAIAWCKENGIRYTEKHEEKP